MALTLKMTTAQVVEASALSGTVNISHIQDYVHPVDDAQLTYFLSIAHVYLKENLILKTSVWRLRLHTKNFSHICLLLQDALI